MSSKTGWAVGTARLCGCCRSRPVVGREVDLGLLARVAAVDVRTCRGPLEPAEVLGLMSFLFTRFAELSRVEQSVRLARKLFLDAALAPHQYLKGRLIGSADQRAPEHSAAEGPRVRRGLPLCGRTVRPQVGWHSALTAR